MGTQEETGVRPAEEMSQWEVKARRFLKSDFVRSLPYWGIPFLIMGAAVYLGIGYNVAISLTDYQGLAAIDWSQLDFQMYTRALQDDAFIKAARNTFVLLVGFTTLSLLFGLGLAILLDRQFRYKEKVQMIYLLPMSLSFVVTAQLWLWMYDPNSGVLNVILTTFGIGPIDFLGNPKIALAAVMFALIWQFSGYTMVVFLAGLRAIPQSQFEAAMVDGASTTRTYLRVIIPQLKPASVSATVVLMVFALKAFTFLYSLVGRYRPPTGTDIIATLMVRHAFKFTEWAYAAAMATMLLLMALGVVSPYLYYQYKRGAL